MSTNPKNHVRQLMLAVVGSALGLTLTAVTDLSIPSAFAQNDAKAGETEQRAAKKKEKEKKEEKVRTGLIANTGTFSGSGAVSVHTDGASPGDESNVISGSVSPIGRGQCSASVTNKSKENSYTVRFAVEGRRSGGTLALNRSFSATLGPEETVTKTLSCGEDLDLSVVLKSANKRS